MATLGTTTKISPITTEVIRHELISAAEQIRRVFKSSTTLAILHEMNDFGISIYDSAIRLIADVPGAPSFSGSLDYCVRSTVQQIGLDRLRPGDVFTTTMPFDIGTHPADAAILAPVFVDDEIVAYTSIKAHVGDVGAIDPYPTASTDIYQEGLIMPAMYLYRAGVLQEEVVRLIQFNSRIPKTTANSFLAAASAVRSGGQRVATLVRKYGVATFKAAIDEMIAHGARVAAAALRQLPEGTWEALDWMDNNGVDKDPVRLSVKITIKNGRFIVDLSDSAPQQRGPVNSPFPGTFSACRYAFKALTSPLAPANDGHFAPLEVIAPPGNLFHPLPPAATFLYGWPEDRLLDLIPMALAKAMPDRVPAHSGGDLAALMFTYFDSATGRGDYGGSDDGVGMGATYDADGESALMHHTGAGFCNIPVEVQEWRVPIMIKSYSLRTDSGGAGKFRGGVGVCKEYRTLAPSTAISVVERTEASKVVGIDGGKAAPLNTVIFFPGTEKEVRRGKCLREMQPGDELTILTAGGCGWGNPYQRDPEHTLQDVYGGYVSVEGAKSDYGVVIVAKGHDYAIDFDATSQLRSELTSSSLRGDK